MLEKLSVVRQTYLYLILVSIASLGFVNLPQSDFIGAYNAINNIALTQKALASNPIDKRALQDLVFDEYIRNGNPGELVVWYNKSLTSKDMDIQSLRNFTIYFRNTLPSDSAERIGSFKTLSGEKISIYFEDLMNVIKLDSLSKPQSDYLFASHFDFLDKEDISDITWYMTPTEALEYLTPFYMAQKANKVSIGGLWFNATYLSLLIPLTLLLISIFMFLHLKNIEIPISTPIKEIDKIPFVPIYPGRTAFLLSLFFLSILPSLVSFLVVRELKQKMDANEWNELMSLLQLWGGYITVFFQLIVSVRIYLVCQRMRAIIERIEIGQSGFE